MDNVGDWIYIVFLIVAAISGLFSSKNKKKRPTQVLGQPGHDSYPEENTSSGKGFWEILEEATTPKSRKHQLHRSIKRKKRHLPQNHFYPPSRKSKSQKSVHPNL